MSLDLLMMLVGALFCASVGWLVLYLSTKINRRSGRARREAARR
jgi:hypothetical protein